MAKPEPANAKSAATTTATSTSTAGDDCQATAASAAQHVEQHDRPLAGTLVELLRRGAQPHATSAELATRECAGQHVAGELCEFIAGTAGTTQATAHVDLRPVSELHHARERVQRELRITSTDFIFAQQPVMQNMVFRLLPLGAVPWKKD